MKEARSSMLQDTVMQRCCKTRDIPAADVHEEEWWLRVLNSWGDVQRCVSATRDHVK
jgi:hypothetical protein